ncbi:DNA adenine methylase [Winogradskyella sp.]|uniref:DNA adenine methylase n=1 Tax=Winogradskyella sp. TaxID=1883156 RepID=UPI003BAA5A5B
MKTEVKRPVLRYHGGKWKLAPWIISHFPEHKVYVEPFGGGASVLLRKSRSYAEVYNDMWDVVVNVFKVLRDPDLSESLKSQLELTPFSRLEFEQTGDIDLELITDPVEKARRTIFRSFAGFGSAATNAKYATGFRANSNRSGTTPAHDWNNYPTMIDSFVKRLRGVVVENRPAIDVIKAHDTEDTLHYIDPPYVHSTRNMKRGNAAYAHEMSNQDHIDLFNVINETQGMVILSGYPSDLYSDLYKDWLCISKSTHADGAVDRVECLWLNDAAAQKQKQLSMFK